MSILKGTAYWIHTVKPNKRFNSDGVYTIDVCNLDETNIKKAKEDGLLIKNKNDSRENYVTIKRNVRNKNGNLNKVPVVVDKHKNHAPETLIGNGSKVSVMYNPYSWEFAGKKGVSADFVAVQVIKLVLYNKNCSFKAEDNLISINET